MIRRFAKAITALATVLVLLFAELPVDSRALHGGVVNPSAPFAPTVQVSFGTSITAGFFASPTTLGYAYLYSTAISTALSNWGASGSHACDNNKGSGVIAYASGGYDAVPSLTANTVYTYEQGANDTASGSSYEPIFDLCNEASISWLAIPSTSKVLAQNCTQAGTWTDDTLPAPSNGRSSTTSGSTLTCSITTQGKTLFLWYRAIDSSSGTFTYNLDGGGAVSVNCFTSPATGVTDAWIVKRITGVSSGAHSLVITVTSSGQTIDIWAIGSAPSTAYTSQMRTVVLNVLRQQGDANAANTLAYSNDVAAEIALLQGDGLPLTAADTRSAVNTTTDMFDTLHPNNTGHVNMKTAVLAVFP